MKNQDHSTLFSAPAAVASGPVLARIPSDIALPDPDPGWFHDPALRSSLVYAREITRHHAKSFHFASWHLPAFRRHAAFAVYSFCRYIDDRIDASIEIVPDRRELIDTLDAILSGSSPLPFAPAFRAATETFSIPRSVLLQLIEGCCRDREPAAFESFAELEIYCYDVASVVGLMMSPVFGIADLRALPLAVDMGIAMQLTNILRDVREDFQMGRRYLPAQDLRAAGLDLASELQRPTPSAAWRAWTRSMIATTRNYYQSGLRGLEALAPDGSRQATRTMAVVYAGILSAIEAADGDNLTARRYVPLHRKIRLALSARFFPSRSLAPAQP